MTEPDPRGADLFGPQTRLAIDNFPATGRRLDDVPELLRAYARIKAASALANVELGAVDAARGSAIVRAAHEVAEGLHPDQFPTALVQGGGGTSTNMNVNEVIAARATQLLLSDPGAAADPTWTVHPNDHVNRSQSTNDTYPTAMALTLLELTQPAGHALEVLELALLDRARAFKDVARLGRTCLQDAVPLTVGQTHTAQAAALGRHRVDLAAAAEALTALPIGATAIGTGVGAPDGFAERAVHHLNELTGRSLTTAPDYFDALAHLDPYLSLAGAIVRPAVTMAKIAADLRLLSSGPKGGLDEVRLPVLQAGSSIMPGKVNPVIPELVMQYSYRIRGAAHTVELAVAAGELELNVMEPVVLDALVGSLSDLTVSATTFAQKCVAGLTWNRAAVDRHLQGSLERLVEDAGRLGYQHATQRAARNTP